jgi:hypothetical protein
MSHCQKAGQKHSIKIVNSMFVDVAKLRYLGTTLKRSKLHAKRDLEQTKFRECLLPFVL